MFASTKRLNLRGFRESDGERMVALQYDRRVARTSNPDDVSAKSEAQTLKANMEFIKNAFLFLIVEVKPANDDDLGGSSADKEKEDRWVGFVTLGLPVKKNSGGYRRDRVQAEMVGQGFRDGGDALGGGLRVRAAGYAPRSAIRNVQ